MTDRPKTAPPIRYGEMAPRAPEEELDLESFLPGEGDIEVDVGFGRGASLITRAKVAPEARLLGIEIKAKWATKVEEWRVSLGLERVRVLCGDARLLLANAGPAGCVKRCFVHFPDPWWKQRHLKRRVVGEAFLDAVARLMVPGGELYIQTDVQDRVFIYAQTVEDHPAFTLEGGGYLEENPYDAPSNRERHAAEDGLPVFRLLAFRVASEGRESQPREGGDQREAGDR